MQYVCPIAIPLEFLPHPDGDNRLDVHIREGETTVTYFSSSRAFGGARYIKVVFERCFAARFVVSDEHEKLCPGITSIESEFAEIRESVWLQTLPDYVQSFKHFVLAINHSFFECIAEGVRVEPQSRNT